MDLFERIKSIRRIILSSKVYRDKLFHFERLQILIQKKKKKTGDMIAYIDFEVTCVQLYSK